MSAPREEHSPKDVPLKDQFTAEEKRGVAMRTAARAIVYAHEPSYTVGLLKVGPLGNLWSGLCGLKCAPGGAAPMLPDKTLREEQLRAHIRALMAGSIALGIMVGKSDSDIRPQVWDDDGATTMAYCMSLPSPNGPLKYNRLLNETIVLLRDTTTWGLVMAVAEALDQRGTLMGEELQGLLRSAGGRQKKNLEGVQ